jgi:hypothetical protein
MTHHRFLRVVANPTADQIVRASGGLCCTLPIGHEVQCWHHGEDGPMLELHDLRGPTYIDQDVGFGDVQEWYALEMMHDVHLIINEEE